jgi:hypothetical protein
METPPGPERVSRRLREQFAPAYLAITGLVQVLVLDALITKVEGGYSNYARPSGWSWWPPSWSVWTSGTST